MKQYTLSCAILALCLLSACSSEPAQQTPAYEQNVASMKAMFDGFQNKSIDPSLFAEDFVDVGTGFEAVSYTHLTLPTICSV